jgi:hypothetical protein
LALCSRRLEACLLQRQLQLPALGLIVVSGGQEPRLFGGKTAFPVDGDEVRFSTRS